MAVPGMVTMAGQPLGGDVPPEASVSVGAAGLPAVLPGLPRLAGQPVQQEPEPKLARTPLGWGAWRERRAGQLRPDRLLALPGSGPARLVAAGVPVCQSGRQ